MSGHDAKSISELQRLEFKEAFEEFDKVIIIMRDFECNYIKKIKLCFTAEKRELKIFESWTLLVICRTSKQKIWKLFLGRNISPNSGRRRSKRAFKKPEIRWRDPKKMKKQLRSKTFNDFKSPQNWKKGKEELHLLLYSVFPSFFCTRALMRSFPVKKLEREKSGSIFPPPSEPTLHPPPRPRGNLFKNPPSFTGGEK